MQMADTEFDTDIETLEVETEEVAEATDETNAIQADELTEEGDEEADEVIISIGEETPPQEEEVRAPEWVRELRKANREKERKIRELEAKLNATATETKPVALGPKPDRKSVV